MSIPCVPRLLVCASGLIVTTSAIAAGAPQTFPLPAPHKINVTRPLDCRAIAGTSIGERNGQLEAEASKGTDHFEVIRTGRFLRVTALHDATQIGQETDLYMITAETADFLSAVQGVKVLPVIHGLVINKRLGSAVWSESDSALILASDYPFAASVFLNCTN
jgi:hypothetical protein